MKSSFINSHDNKKIYLYVWDNVENPIGVVQIFHGMAEHAARYSHFAEFLNSKGFIVYADDHRGHGKTAGSIDKLGFLGEDGFNNIVKDEHFISNIIKTKYPTLPLFIFCHSFGSFVGQEYLNHYSKDIQGIIICGSAKQSKVVATAGIMMSSLLRKFGDETKPSPFLESIIFGSYNKKEKANASKVAWLSSDKDEVKKYEHDEYCGTVFTPNFYYHMLKGFTGLYSTEKSSTINKNIPINIIAGDMDPVGNYGKSVRALYNYYNNLNINDVSIKLYKDCRHELLNEVNKLDIYDDILTWISNRI